MKLKEVSVSAKLTRDFDSHMVTETYVVDEREQVDSIKLLDDLTNRLEKFMEQKKAMKSLLG